MVVAMNAATTSASCWLRSAEPVCARSFSSARVVHAAAKKAAPKSQQKKKVPVRKAGGGGGGGGASGPRSPRRTQTKSGSVQEGLSRTNPFARPRADMGYLPALLPEHATEAKVGQVMAWSERTLEATRIQTFGLTREMAREVRERSKEKRKIHQKQNKTIKGKHSFVGWLAPN